MKTVRTKQDVVEILRSRCESIRALGVSSLLLFGSFARDEAGSQSDVDLLVDFLPGEKTFDHFMALSFLLEDVLGRSVELLTRESLSPYMGSRILQEAENVLLAA